MNWPKANAAGWCLGSLPGAQFRHILFRILIEVRQTILAAKLYLVAIANKGVILPRFKRLVRHDALLEGIRLNAGCGGGRGWRGRGAFATENEAYRAGNQSACG